MDVSMRSAIKSTGIVRPLDHLGRLVIPKEIRRVYGLLQNRQPMEIFTDEDGNIILRKYNPFCNLCGSTEKLKEIKGKKFCEECRIEMQNSLSEED